MHFFVEPGSGKMRGFCMNCAAVTCGAAKCGPCCHWKKKMELIEKGADKNALYAGNLDKVPVSVSAGGVLLGK